MKCKQCQGDIQDDSKFCNLCGANQQENALKDKVGVLILDCQHCKGTCECKEGKTLDKIHSCEYCISKSGLKSNNPFPHVPCAYCGGKGKHVIDLKIEKPKQEQKKGGQNGQRR